MKQSERGDHVVLITRYSLSDTFELNCAAWQVPETEADQIPRILLDWLRVNMGLECPIHRSEPVRNDDHEVWDWIARHFGNTREFNLRIIWPQHFLPCQSVTMTSVCQKTREQCRKIGTRGTIFGKGGTGMEEALDTESKISGVKLLVGSWDTHLVDLVRSARQDLCLVSPFIRRRPLELIARTVNERPVGARPDVRIVTNLGRNQPAQQFTGCCCSCRLCLSGQLQGSGPFAIAACKSLLCGLTRGHRNLCQPDYRRTLEQSRIWSLVA